MALRTVGEKNIKTKMDKKVLEVLHKMTKIGHAMFRPIGLCWAQEYGQSRTKRNRKCKLLI
jgi:hypothetical protein